MFDPRAGRTGAARRATGGPQTQEGIGGDHMLREAEGSVRRGWGGASWQLRPSWVAVGC